MQGARYVSTHIRISQNVKVAEIKNYWSMGISGSLVVNMRIRV